MVLETFIKLADDGTVTVQHTSSETKIDNDLTPHLEVFQHPSTNVEPDNKDVVELLKS